MQFENLTKGQFIRDFKDTIHQEQLIRVAKACLLYTSCLDISYQDEFK